MCVIERLRYRPCRLPTFEEKKIPLFRISVLAVHDNRDYLPQPITKWQPITIRTQRKGVQVMSDDIN